MNDRDRRLQIARIQLDVETRRRESCLKRAANTDRPSFRRKMLVEADLAAASMAEQRQRIAAIEAEFATGPGS